VSSEELWTEVAKGMAPFGLRLNGVGHLHFGHPDCTRFVPLLILEGEDGSPKPLELLRAGSEDLKIMAELYALGLGGVAFRDDRPVEKVLRALGLLRAAPGFFLVRVRRWLGRRLRAEAGTSLGRLALALLAGRTKLGSFTITSHHFMSPAELQTDLGKARLDACVFRLPYRGEMVPMCRMNAAGVREQLYAEIAGGEA
jgi:hypothetical protein